MEQRSQSCQLLPWGFLSLAKAGCPSGLEQVLCLPLSSSVSIASWYCCPSLAMNVTTPSCQLQHKPTFCCQGLLEYTSIHSQHGMGPTYLHSMSSSLPTISPSSVRASPGAGKPSLRTTTAAVLGRTKGSQLRSLCSHGHALT